MQFPNNFFSTLVTIILQIAQNGAILFYNGAPGAGTLVGSLSPKAGTDQFGNTFPAGYRFSDGTVSITETTATIFGLDSPLLSLSTGSVSEVSPLEIFSVFNSPVIESVISGAMGTLIADKVTIALFSGQANSPGVSSFGVLTYFPVGSAGNIGIPMLEWDFTGANVTGSLVSVDPTTGLTSTNFASGESWHAPVLNAGFSSFGAPAAPVGYQIEGMNGKRTRLRGEISLTANQGANTTIFTLPTQYRPQFQSEYFGANTLSGAVAGRGGIIIDNGGNVRLAVAGVTGNAVQLNGICFELGS